MLRIETQLQKLHYATTILMYTSRNGEKRQSLHQEKFYFAFYVFYLPSTPKNFFTGSQ